MELQVGMIEHTQTYKDNFDLGDEKVNLEAFGRQYMPRGETIATKQSNMVLMQDEARRLNVNSSHPELQEVTVTLNCDSTQQ